MRPPARGTGSRALSRLAGLVGLTQYKARAACSRSAEPLAAALGALRLCHEHGVYLRADVHHCGHCERLSDLGGLSGCLHAVSGAREGVDV